MKRAFTPRAIIAACLTTPSLVLAKTSFNLIKDF
jgi:hypothetical protein